MPAEEGRQARFCRGRLPIQLDKPVIDPDYLDDPYDDRAMLAGIRWNRRVLAAKAFAEALGEELTPGAGRTERRRAHRVHSQDGFNDLASRMQEGTSCALSPMGKGRLLSRYSLAGCYRAMSEGCRRKVCCSRS
jgi:hypothetical protein